MAAAARRAEQFGVGGGVGLRLHRVAGAGQHRAVRRQHHRADRYFPARRGSSGFFQCDLHGGHAQPGSSRPLPPSHGRRRPATHDFPSCKQGKSWVAGLRRS